MTKKSSLPSISILTITLNPNPQVFKKVLESIKNQDYPKYLIEHIIVDGGSKKNTISFLKKYGCKLIIKSELREQSEARRVFAVKEARNEIILWLESDNSLSHNESLRELVQPFMDDNKIFSTFTLHYGINKEMKVLDRYCALLGVSDPVAFYLNKADRETWLTNTYEKGKIIKRRSNYDTVEFNKSNLPTVGDNGFLTRRKVLLKANISFESYLHIDIYVDLLKLGYKRFGVVKKVNIEHDIGKGILNLVRRRVLYVKRYSLSKYINHRRYAVFDFNSSKDVVNLLKYIFYTVTFIQPLFLSTRGFLKIRDTAWFLHPFMCWLFLIYYLRFTSFSLLKLKLSKKL